METPLSQHAPPQLPRLPLSARRAHVPPPSALAAVVPLGGADLPPRARLHVAPPAAPPSTARREAFGINAIDRRRHVPVEHVDVSAHAKLVSERMRFENGLSEQRTARTQQSAALHMLDESGGGSGTCGPAVVATPTGLQAFRMPSARGIRGGECGSAEAQHARANVTADHLIVGERGLVPAPEPLLPPRLSHQPRRQPDQSSGQARSLLGGGGSSDDGVADAAQRAAAANTGTGFVSIRRHHDEIFGGRAMWDALPHAQHERPPPPPAATRPEAFTSTYAAEHAGRQAGGPVAHLPRKRTFGGCHRSAGLDPYAPTSLW